MADVLFEENGPILPSNLAWIMTAVLVATLAFMCIMHSDIGWTGIAVVAVFFAIAIALAFLLKLSVKVTGDGVEMFYMIRRRTFPRDMVIDKRKGRLEDIRSYSQWNLKGVSHRSYLRTGDEDGVALKLKGKAVVVISSADPDAFFDAVPTEIIGDDARCRLPCSTGSGSRPSATPPRGRSSSRRPWRRSSVMPTSSPRTSPSESTAT